MKGIINNLGPDEIDGSSFIHCPRAQISSAVKFPKFFFCKRCKEIENKHEN